MYKRSIDKNKEQIGEKRIHTQAHKKKVNLCINLELM